MIQLSKRLSAEQREKLIVCYTKRSVAITYITQQLSELYVSSRYSDWLRAGRSDDGGSIPGGGWKFISLTQCPDRLWDPPSLQSNGYQESFPGSKAAGARS